MDQAPHDAMSGGPVYRSRQWWRSRTGQEICHQCYPDALVALQALVNQLNGAATSVEKIGQSAIDMPDNVPPENGFWSLEDTLRPGTHWPIVPRGLEGHQHGTTLPSPAALIP
jgi:hypothetical protein